MESLICDFVRATTLSTINPTPFDLRLHDNAVYSFSHIPQHTILGEIRGDPRNIWDIKHKDYMLISTELAIDLSCKCTRSIVTFIREENETEMLPNCTVIVIPLQDGSIRYYMKTIIDVYPGTELVYWVERSM